MYVGPKASSQQPKIKLETCHRDKEAKDKSMQSQPAAQFLTLQSTTLNIIIFILTIKEIFLRLGRHDKIKKDSGFRSVAKDHNTGLMLLFKVEGTEISGSNRF